MSDTATPHPTTLAYRILQQAQLLLADDGEAAKLPLAELLTVSAGLLPTQEHELPGAATLDRALGEAAAHVLARCRIPIKVDDPTALYWLGKLDQLPSTARLGVITAALRYTISDDQLALEPHGSGPRARIRERVACPCLCNSGGFCGGCGHAGCGGRR